MFDAQLIEKLEKELQFNPRAYRMKVLLLAVLGNLYIAFGVAGLGLMFGLACLSVLLLKAFALKLIIPAAILLYVVLRSLWIKIEKPQGIEIVQEDAPELFALIGRLRFLEYRLLRSPRPAE